MEVVCAIIVMYTLRFNKEKTEKLGKLYDELNITADDYTLYANISSRHRQEFMEKYGNKLEQQERTQAREVNASRGQLFKKYIQEKMHVDRVNIARIDLVFDNKNIIDLLEARGNALKVENMQILREIEDQIEAIKPFQYQADVVGVFITYERNEDIRKI
jgi:hypothetical protein